MADAKPRILIQLDTSPHASVFDAVTAIDAGLDHLLQYREVQPDQVRDLIHGAMFTRGPGDLKSTAVFIGGASVDAGEALLEAVKKVFFGPFRVSVLFDSSGANTTAAAAVLAATREFEGALAGVPAAVLGATGPVGRRVARLLCRQGAVTRIGSRELERASQVADSIQAQTGVRPASFASTTTTLAAALDGVQIVISAGAACARTLPDEVWTKLPALKVLIDLNAVPPLGIEGVEVADRSTPRGHVRAWGAIGVGGLKMKIHKQAVRTLFASNDAILDAEEILAIGQAIDAPAPP